MPTPVAGIVGPSLAADGAKVEFRQDHTGAMVISQNQARYTELMARGQIFSAANQAAQAVSVALATAYTGIALYNPIGSGKILIPLKIKFALSVAPAASATLGLISAVQTAAPTGTTPLTVRSNQIGNGAAGTGLAYSAATIATPVWHQQLRDGFTAAALPNPTAIDDLEGMIGIIPGGLLAVGALTAVTGLGSIAWAELPYYTQG